MSCVQPYMVHVSAGMSVSVFVVSIKMGLHGNIRCMMCDICCMMCDICCMMCDICCMMCKIFHAPVNHFSADIVHL